MEDSGRQRSVASPLSTTIDQHPGHADHTTSTLRGVELELAVLIGSDCSSVEQGACRETRDVRRRRDEGDAGTREREHAGEG